MAFPFFLILSFDYFLHLQFKFTLILFLSFFFCGHTWIFLGVTPGSPLRNHSRGWFGDHKRCVWGGGGGTLFVPYKANTHFIVLSFWFFTFLWEKIYLVFWDYSQPFCVYISVLHRKHKSLRSDLIFSHLHYSEIFII